MKTFKALVRVKATSWEGLRCKAEGSQHFADEIAMAAWLQGLDRVALRAMFPDYREIESYSVDCETTEHTKVGNVNRTVTDRWPYRAKPAARIEPKPDAPGGVLRNQLAAAKVLSP